MTSVKITKVEASSASQLVVSIEVTLPDGKKETLDKQITISAPYTLDQVKGAVIGEIRYRYGQSISGKAVNNAKAVLLNKTFEIGDENW